MPKQSLKDFLLPARSGLGFLYFSSTIILILIIGISITEIILQQKLYTDLDLLQLYVPNAKVNLMIAAPFLLTSMILTSRGKLSGLLAWIGALLFIVYSYLTLLIRLPVNFLFLPYTFLVALSIYTLISLFSSVDHQSVQSQLSSKLPARTATIILMGLALLVLGRQVGLVLQALINNTTPTGAETAVWIADSNIMTPAMLISGVLLWKKKPLAYSAAISILGAYTMLSLGLIPLLYFQEPFTQKSVQPADIIVLGVMALVCLIPLFPLLRKSQKTK